MRAPKLWFDIASWRWSPTVGLLLGSLLYVGVTVLAIPDHIGDGEPVRAQSSFSLFGATRNRPAALEANVSPSVPEPEADAANTHLEVRRAPAARSGGGFPRRGFSPPLPRPEPAAAPPPPPPAPPPITIPQPAPVAVAPPAAAQAAQPATEAQAPQNAAAANAPAGNPAQAPAQAEPPAGQAQPAGAALPVSPAGPAPSAPPAVPD